MLPPDDEALQSDVYLEALLDAHRRVPRAVSRADAVDPELRRTAEALDRTLVRFHIRGESRPATEAIPFPHPTATARADDDPRDAVNRLLVGGAIASGVSLAGAAAWVAWRRRSRPETVA